MDFWIHNKTGNKYQVVTTFGFKFFRKWFYFYVYKNEDIDMYFIRTNKDFLAKFTHYQDLRYV